MNYAIEILLEQKELLTEELRFAEGKEREQAEKRLIDTAIALNDLNEPDTSGSFSDWYNKGFKDGLAHRSLKCKCGNN
jgi:hypothetical protein